MARAKISPVIEACKTIAGAVGIPIGDGVAPDCPSPYIVIDSVSSRRYSGPFGDTEADSADRIQFACIGVTREVAGDIRDDIRALLTEDALNAEFVSQGSNRRTMQVILDIPRGVQRDDRGLPEPIFSAIDQYLISTTPFTP